MKIYIIFLILPFLFVACETDQDRFEKAEKECANQTKIDGFAISFFGYFPEDADSINIKIKRNGKFILEYDDIVPQEITDSLRHQRNYFVKNEILLTDTVLLKIKGEADKIITDFTYSVRPHFTMMSKDWGCDFYDFKVDGIAVEGATVMFVKKDSKWQSIDRYNYQNYYSKKN